MSNDEVPGKEQRERRRKNAEPENMTGLVWQLTRGYLSIYY